jgi:hypothetical protein
MQKERIEVNWQPLSPPPAAAQVAPDDRAKKLTTHSKDTAHPHHLREPRPVGIEADRPPTPTPPLAGDPGPVD